MAPRQLSLLSNYGPHTAVRDVKTALASAAKGSNESREHVLDQVNDLARRYGIKLSGNAGLSKDMFDKWLNAEDDSRVPGIKGLVLLCLALDTAEPLDAIARTIGAKVISGDDITLLELARAQQESKRLRKMMRKLEEELG